MRDAVGEGVGLAGSGAGDHQQRRRRTGPCAMFDGASLLRVEAVKVGGCRLQGVLSSLDEKSESSILVIRTMTAIRLTLDGCDGTRTARSILAGQYEQIKNNSLGP